MCSTFEREKKNRKRSAAERKRALLVCVIYPLPFTSNGTGADSFYLHGPLRLNQIGESIMIQP